MLNHVEENYAFCGFGCGRGAVGGGEVIKLGAVKLHVQVKVPAPREFRVGIWALGFSIRV